MHITPLFAEWHWLQDLVGKVGYDLLKYVFVTFIFVGLAKYWRGTKVNADVKFWVPTLIAAATFTIVLMRYSSDMNASAPRMKTEANYLVMRGGSDPTMFQIVCDMAVRNTGAPSILRDWRLFIKRPDGNTVNAYTAEKPFDTVITCVNPYGGTNTYTKDDWLMTKTAEKEVGHNGSARGIAVFSVHGVSTNYICIPGTVYSVVFKDAQDQQYTCDFTWK